MNSINFLLVVHNHQPIGNFESVMERVHTEAYAPFLDVLARFPSVRIGMHLSGCLLDWLQAAHPEYLDRVALQVARGQIELLGGAYYEPILPAIPEEDRRGQIEKLSRALEARFGKRPSGAWIAERVWEPDLAGSLHRAGIRYTLLDDTHFLAAGADPGALDAPYWTEDRGRAVAVFPISKRLRYLVPFRPPEETVEFLRREAAQGPGRVFVLGDDGEKFGHWPDTHQLVYGERWLDRFFGLLVENQAWLSTGFPSEHVPAAERRGRIYLPTASYEEMGEWTLPAPVQGAYREFHEDVAAREPGQIRFVRGGTWRAFLARYPESDLMTQRGLALREEARSLETVREAAARNIQDLLWASQCNCAYWHGVFGGIYLPHLRDAVWQRLLEADDAIQRVRRGNGGWAEAVRVDLDADCEPEVLLRNDRLTAVVDPARGGSLIEFSLRKPPLALGNGFTRRYEAYHDRLHQAAPASLEAGTGASIHDRLTVKEPDLDQFLKYDSYPRVSLIDHAFDPGAGPEGFEAGAIPDPLGLRGPCRVAVAADEAAATVVLRRVSGGSMRPEWAVEKTLRLPAGTTRLEVDYRLEPMTGDLELGFGVEWNLAMLDAGSPDRKMLVEGGPGNLRLDSTGRAESVLGVRLVDGERGFQVALSWDREAEVRWSPVETVSLSETGLERVYQSTALLPWWRVCSSPGRPFAVRILAEISSLG